ncbi:hypothetical protein AAMO2058_000178500 [Amorphochlora amoebiformis]
MHRRYDKPHWKTASGEPPRRPVVPPPGGQKWQAVALYDFDPREADELRLRAGETVIVEKKHERDAWWEGLSGGRRGCFPSNFVRVTGSAPPATRSHMSGPSGFGRGTAVVTPTSRNHMSGGGHSNFATSTGAIPQAPRNIPQAPRNIPQALRNIPQDPRNIPQAPRNIPQAPRNIPQAPRNIPQAPRNIPQAPRNIPQAQRNIPQAPRNIPQVHRNIPHAPRNIPQATRNIPQAPRSISQARRNIPQAPKNIPLAPRNIPQAARNIPQARRNIPQDPRNIPQNSRSQIPQNSRNHIPQNSRNHMTSRTIPPTSRNQMINARTMPPTSRNNMIQPSPAFSPHTSAPQIPQIKPPPQTFRPQPPSFPASNQQQGGRGDIRHQGITAREGGVDPYRRGGNRGRGGRGGRDERGMASWESRDSGVAAWESRDSGVASWEARDSGGGWESRDSRRGRERDVGYRRERRGYEGRRGSRDVRDRSPGLSISARNRSRSRDRDRQRRHYDPMGGGMRRGFGGGQSRPDSPIRRPMHSAHGAPMGQFGGRRGGEFKEEGSVLFLRGLDRKRPDPDALFHIFQCYGDVLRVKILWQKEDQALVELSSPDEAQDAYMNLSGGQLKLWGNEIAVDFSRNPTIRMKPHDRQTKEYASLSRDYTDSKMRLRWSRKKRVPARPSRLLFVYGLPRGTSYREVYEHFRDFDPDGVQIMNKNTRIALVRFPTFDLALDALINRNDSTLKREHIRICFSTQEPESLYKIVSARKILEDSRDYQPDRNHSEKNRPGLGSSRGRKRDRSRGSSRDRRKNTNDPDPDDTKPLRVLHSDVQTRSKAKKVKNAISKLESMDIIDLQEEHDEDNNLLKPPKNPGDSQKTSAENHQEISQENSKENSNNSRENAQENTQENIQENTQETTEVSDKNPSDANPPPNEKSIEGDSASLEKAEAEAEED